MYQTSDAAILLTQEIIKPWFLVASSSKTQYCLLYSIIHHCWNVTDHSTFCHRFHDCPMVWGNKIISLSINHKSEHEPGFENFHARSMQWRVTSKFSVLQNLKTSSGFLLNYFQLSISSWINGHLLPTAVWYRQCQSRQATGCNISPFF